MFKKYLLSAILALGLSAPAFCGQFVDISVASNGCPALVAGSGVDAAPAIQCQIDYLHANYGGGIINIPAGAFDIATTINITGAEVLKGKGPAVSALRTLGGADITALKYTGGANSYGGMDNLRVICSQSTVSTAPCVWVGFNTPVTFRDCHIWGGGNALKEDGVDGLIENCIIAAMARNGSNLYSRGANWYVRTKFNPYAGQVVSFAYVQTTWTQSPNNGLQENHFVQCDFSGIFDYAVGINDSGLNQSITVFDSSVFAAPIYVWAAKATIFTGNEFGNGTLQSASPISVSGNLGLVPMGVGGAGTKACAANIGISC